MRLAETYLAATSVSGMPKRVLLMVSSMRGGGSERQVLLLARHLDRTRFKPHLYLTEAAGDLLERVPADVPIHAFDSCESGGGIYLPGRQLRRQTAFLRGVISEAQIDVLYERTFHMTLVAGPVSERCRRVPTIVSPPDQALPSVEKRFVALKRRRLARAYRRADAIVAVSGQAARSAETYYGLPAGRIRVVRNPVDVEALRQDVSETECPHRHDLTTLVCVARMTAEKGHVDLIRSLPEVLRRWPAERKPLRLRLVGQGPLRSELESLVESLGLSSTVDFVGAVASSAGEIASADALVLPSRFEGLPNVVLEAMALGTPVIATRAGGTIELETDRPTAFWARPGDSASIAQAILALADQPKTAFRHRDAAIQLIHQRHDLNTAVHQIEDLLDPPS